MSAKKYLQTLQSSFIFGLGFFLTVCALSIGYSAFISSYPATVGTGSGLSSTEWNKIVSGLQTLDSKLSTLSFSGANVGIGMASPGVKLDITQTVDAPSLRISSNQPTYLSSNQSALQITTTNGTSNPTVSYALSATYNGSNVFQVRNDGSITANGFTTSTAWTAVAGNGTWSSDLVCRRVGSFLQFRGQLYTVWTTNTSGWPVAGLPSLPSNCWPSANIYFIPGVFWTTGGITTAGLIQITPAWVISAYNNNSIYVFSFAGNFPAE